MRFSSNGIIPQFRRGGVTPPAILAIPTNNLQKPCKSQGLFCFGKTIYSKNTPRIPKKRTFSCINLQDFELIYLNIVGYFRLTLRRPFSILVCCNGFIVWPASLTARILSLTKFYLITTFSATIAISAYFPTHLHKISQRSFPWKNLTVCVLPTTR